MIIAIGAFLVAGTIKGTLGIGLPIAAVGLMTLFIDPRLAMSLLVFPIMFTNMWQCYRGGRFIQTAKKYGLFAVILSLSLLITTNVTAEIDPQWLIAAVGIIVVLFSLTNLFFRPIAIPSHLDRLFQALGGGLAGLMGGLTAVWSPPIAFYLLSKNVDKDEFVRATGFLFLIGSLPLCIGFFANGLMDTKLALVSIGMILPSLLGFFLGEGIRRMLNPERFKSLVLICFLVIGVNLILKAFITV